MFVSTLLMLPIFGFLVLIYPRFAVRMGWAHDLQAVLMTS
jgi:hypothetical protein